MTSIEWLGYELNTKLFYDISPELWQEVNKIFEQAKEMHKQEIIDAYYQCGRDNFEHIKVINKSATEYYQETFVSKGSDDHISDISKMVEDDVEKLAENNDWEEHIWDDDVNKIAENIFPYDIHRTDYATEECRRIFILGFEKAKETLFTFEQMMEGMLQISEYYADNLGKNLDGHKKALEIIQSLKQPKKD